VINVRNGRFEVLDNLPTGEMDKYKNIPEDLVSSTACATIQSYCATIYFDCATILQRLFFGEYLLKAGMDDEAKMLAGTPFIRLEMPWRQEKNHVDCGIYVMRHMETYFGNGLEGFDSGLVAGDENQMTQLRVKYCASIIQNSLNEKRLYAGELVAKAFKKSKETR